MIKHLSTRHPGPIWIEKVLQAFRTASIRKRKLPAEQVVWSVLGIGL
ncbi:transposase domain-containing protein [Methylophaga sp. OBS4]